MAANRIKQYELKEDSKRSNYVKRADHIIKKGIMYDNVLSTALKFVSDTKTTEYSTESTLKESFICMGENIIDFPDIKNKTVILDIERRWGKYIIK